MAPRISDKQYHPLNPKETPMNSPERMYEEHQPRPSQPSAGPEADEGLARLREAGEEFLRAGDEAIRRALSRDSTEFLAAARQLGGQ